MKRATFAIAVCLGIFSLVAVTSASRGIEPASNTPTQPQQQAERREKFAPAHMMLLNAGISFEPELLLEPDWRTLLAPVFAGMEEMKALLDMRQQSLAGVYLADTLILSGKPIEVADDTLILARRIIFDDPNSWFEGGGQNIYVFPIEPEIILSQRLSQRGLAELAAGAKLLLVNECRDIYFSNNGTDGSNGTSPSAPEPPLPREDNSPGYNGNCTTDPNGENGPPGFIGHRGYDGDNGRGGGNGTGGGTIFYSIPPGSCSNYRLEARGGAGGNGGNGANGSAGGSGGKGGKGGDGASCACPPSGLGPGNGGIGGDGGPGGRGGDGGDGGPGGNGGKGGTVTVSIGCGFSGILDIDVSGGPGGIGGYAGNGGPGGSGGAGGAGGTKGTTSCPGITVSDGALGDRGEPGTMGFPGTPGSQGANGLSGSRSETWESCTPIVIDVETNGYSLTSAQDGVTFDIGANGKPLRVAWTSIASDDAFPALDRNGNGVIDSGAELFGNRTSISDNQSAVNGFEALKVYDLPENGGNADGSSTLVTKSIANSAYGAITTMMESPNQLSFMRWQTWASFGCL